MFATPVVSYLGTYFIADAEGRRGMRSWWVIALACLGNAVLVGMGMVVCIVLDAMTPRKKIPRGFDVVVH